MTGEASAALAEEWVPTTCWIGKQDCGILARRIDGRVVKLEGNPLHPRNVGTLCPKGVAQIMAMYDPNRVKAPLVRTNEKGVSGKWRQVSWDEALTLVGDKIKEVRKRDKRLLVWQKGRSKAKKFYDKAFVKASGATKLHHGAYCSDAGYRAAEYTIGLHGVLHPDFRHCRYLLSKGPDESSHEKGGMRQTYIS
ncbi:MAG: molybdopterin-dependent oxidoreductase [Candidatus Methylomirabilales bacterium]